MSKRVAKMWI